MALPTPFFTEQGAGPGVVCLHANASTSGQWRALAKSLEASCHVLAADLYGAGKSPAWAGERPLALRDEMALLEPVFARAGDPFALVAHSYGAAVALVAAVSQPQRVRALAVYDERGRGRALASSAAPRSLGSRDLRRSASRKHWPPKSRPPTAPSADP
jgi:pimeloyl-ACP methyl ester carboxylesterase